MRSDTRPRPPWKWCPHSHTSCRQRLLRCRQHLTCCKHRFPDTTPCRMTGVTLHGVVFPKRLPRCRLQSGIGVQRENTLVRNVFNPRPVETPDPKAHTPHPKPQTPDPKPQAPNPKSQTPNPKPQTPTSNPKSQTPDLKPQTPNPKPQTPNPKPQTPNPKP